MAEFDKREIKQYGKWYHSDKLCIDCHAVIHDPANSQKRCDRCGEAHRQPYMREYHKQRKQRQKELLGRLRDKIRELEAQKARIEKQKTKESR